MASPLIQAAATTTGAGEIIPAPPGSNHCIHVVYTWATAQPTALAVELLGSLDGVNFVVLGTVTFNGAELTAKQAMLFVTGSPMRYVKSNVKTLTTAGTASINVYYEQDTYGRN